MAIDPFHFLARSGGTGTPKAPTTPRPPRPSTPLQQLRVRSAAAGYRKALRAEALRAYGGKCGCCAETRPAFLIFLYADGKSINGQKPLKELRAAKWPKDAATLSCFNCYLGARIAGTCPHRQEARPVGAKSSRPPTAFDEQAPLERSAS